MHWHPLARRISAWLSDRAGFHRAYARQCRESADPFVSTEEALHWQECADSYTLCLVALRNSWSEFCEMLDATGLADECFEACAV